jgi:hypothetical protein
VSAPKVEGVVFETSDGDAAYVSRSPIATDDARRIVYALRAQGWTASDSPDADDPGVRWICAGWAGKSDPS